RHARTRLGGQVAAGFDLAAGEAEAALALGVGVERGVEILAAEVGPEGAREVELGVGRLPEEEVGDAELAAGADDEVERRQIAGREQAAELVGIEAGRVEAAAGRQRQRAAGRLDDRLAAAVR